MIEIEKNYSPLKTFNRVFMDEDTQQEYEARVQIDFEDLATVEEYVRGEFKSAEDNEMVLIRTYYNTFIVYGNFEKICLEQKKARLHAQINNLSFIKS